MSNARSPREVCSITIGINGLMLAPCCRGSTVSCRSGEIPCRGSRCSRARGRRRPGRALPPRRRGRGPCAAAALADARDGLVRVVAVRLGLLADQLFDLLVRDLEGELVRDGLQDELPG